MSSKFSIYKDMAMLADIAYETIEVNDPTKNGYTVRQNSPANSSGFSATLYQKEDEIILALRGTETNSLEQFYYDVLVADVAELGTKSVPASQVTDMIRFIDGLKNSSDLISGNTKVTIVGHSLGGTLAQIASKMYPSLFDNCYTFNSPSRMSLNYRKIYKDSDGKYYWLGNEQVNFKHYVEYKIGEAFHNYQNTSMTTSVTDVRAKDAFSHIANLWWKERFGERIEVSGTNSNESIWRVA
ncbi:alpha/beta fold hydrolase [Campylobacter sp. RM16187]|uniref:alpha/beta fold hydrolase n=1 Tax=Campylobacter sp. RM16187 TaxID=1660063 RepID=UPI0021B658FF|nr:alpha/beta fold hydrolase [Campylobacter sp. RM16187]QKG28720.1 alpha/beta hydrolase family protein [Campylobacter sp. RM16187]